MKVIAREISLKEIASALLLLLPADRLEKKRKKKAIVVAIASHHYVQTATGYINIYPELQQDVWLLFRACLLMA